MTNATIDPAAARFLPETPNRTSVQARRLAAAEATGLTVAQVTALLGTRATRSSAEQIGAPVDVLRELTAKGLVSASYAPRAYGRRRDRGLYAITAAGLPVLAAARRAYRA